jgi:hypothetical protein
VWFEPENNHLCRETRDFAVILLLPCDSGFQIKVACMMRFELQVFGANKPPLHNLVRLQIFLRMKKVYNFAMNWQEWLQNFRWNFCLCHNLCWPP